MSELEMNIIEKTSLKINTNRYIIKAKTSEKFGIEAISNKIYINSISKGLEKFVANYNFEAKCLHSITNLSQRTETIITS